MNCSIWLEFLKSKQLSIVSVLYIRVLSSGSVMSDVLKTSYVMESSKSPLFWLKLHPLSHLKWKVAREAVTRCILIDLCGFAWHLYLSFLEKMKNDPRKISREKKESIKREKFVPKKAFALIQTHKYEYVLG